MTEDPSQKTSPLVAATSYFLSPFMVSSINVALPATGKEFPLEAVTLSKVGYLG